GFGVPRHQDDRSVWIGCDPKMEAIRARLHVIASNPYPTLVIGERGAGKGQLAWAIHALRNGTSNNMFTLALAGVHEATAESAIFGHERGSFTGAERRHKGFLQL